MDRGFKVEHNGVKKDKNTKGIVVNLEELENLQDVREQFFYAIGKFGKWHLLKAIYILLVIWIPLSFHILNMVFFRAETSFWCGRPETLTNLSAAEWINISAPQLPKEKWNKFGNHNPCQVYNLDFGELYNTYDQDLDKIRESSEYQEAVEANDLRTCDAWEYDKSFWTRTIVSDWDLVCGRKPLQKLTQQITFLGLMVGVFITGMLSDKFGRLPTMLLMVVVNAIFGVISAVSPWYELFLVCIWFCGFTSIGFGTVIFCWLMELLSGKQKTICGCSINIDLSLGGLFVAAIAYLMPDWRHMQLVFSIPLLLLLATYFILPESPRWLLTHDQIEETEKIARRAAKFNGRILPDNFKLTKEIQNHQSEIDHNQGKGLLGFLELFKTPNLRMKTLIMYYLWFAASIIYYGLILNSNDPRASLFTYFVVGKAAEFPAHLIVIFLVLKTGRRISTISLFLACAVSLLATAFITPGTYPNDWPLVALNIFGRGTGVGALTCCYVYSAEIFPTVIRNVGVGSSSLWARIGPMLAPYVADLAIYEPRLPILVFGGFAVLACILSSFLPETSSYRLPDTIEDGETMGKGDTLWTAIIKYIKDKRTAKHNQNQNQVDQGESRL